MPFDMKATALTALIALSAVVSPQPTKGHDISDAANATDPYALAVIEVPRPMAGSLMHLAGVKGRGVATVRIPFTNDCRSFDVILIAGGFWGMDHDADVGPVRMRIYDHRVVKRLVRGHDVVSEDYVVSRDPSERRADIIVESGLPEGTGFILDTTRFRLGGLFRSRGRHVSCDVFIQGGEKQTAFAR